MNRDQAEKAMSSGQTCTAFTSGQVFICWIESILQIKGQAVAVVRTSRGRKQSVSVELISLADVKEVPA